MITTVSKEQLLTERDRVWKTLFDQIHEAKLVLNIAIKTKNGIVAGIPAMDYRSTKFWELTEFLASEFNQFKERNGEAQGVKSATNELFRYNRVSRDGATIKELISYVKGYRELDRVLVNRLYDIHDLERGDDSTGDTGDSFALLNGRDLTLSLADGKLRAQDIPEEYGELYVSSSLEDSMTKWMFITATDKTQDMLGREVYPHKTDPYGEYYDSNDNLNYEAQGIFE
jgi:hypothetical protein